MFGGDTGTAVADLHDRTARGFAHDQIDFAILWRELDGIVHKIGQCLKQQPMIALDGCVHIGRDMGGDIFASAIGA